MTHAHDERQRAPQPGNLRTVPRRTGGTVAAAARMPRAPHAAAVLQRAIGNQAYSQVAGAGARSGHGGQVVQRAPAGAPAAAPEGAKIGLTLAAVEKRFQQMREENPQLAQQQEGTWRQLYQVMAEFDKWMRQIQVGYRFGGSLIAYLHGASREPGDIDIDVSNADNMHVLLNHMKQANSGWSGQPGFRGNELLSIVAEFKSLPGWRFDISSETTGFNNPFVLNESMQLDGDAVETGDHISRDELILNYLDRMLMKPEVARLKGDEEQVAGLLRAAGCHTAADVSAYWSNQLEPAIKPGDTRTSALRDALGKIVSEKFASEPMDLD